MVIFQSYRLLDISTLKKYDSQQMYKVYDNWPDIARKAYAALVCHAIYNAKKDNPKASLDYIIRDLVMKDSFKINYQMTHLIKKRNPKTKKMEYYGDDKSFSKKDSNKLYNSVKKIWTTNKDIRKALEKSDGRSVGPIAKNLKDSLK